MEYQAKSIFISYKNDGEGRHFAGRLADKLENMGFGVYYNPKEQHAGNFPERLRKAVESCKDFILVLTQSCLDQLINHEKIDWVREELLTAYKCNKKIIPLLLSGVSMPKDKDEMPEDLRFLPDTDAILVAEPYDRAPLDILLSWMFSKPEKEDKYKNSFNNNREYDVNQDFIETLSLARSGDVKSMYEIGIMYYFGFSSNGGSGSDADYKEAAKWFLKVAETENEFTAHANTMIAKMYFSGVMPRHGQSFEKCLERYKIAADGDSYAKSKYDLMTLQGLGCCFDYSELEKRIASGSDEQYSDERMDSRLFCEIASIYVSYGQFDKAAKIFERIKRKSPEVEYLKGMLYKRGVYNIAPGSIPIPNYSEAERCFRNASDGNHLEATYELANLYFNPINKELPDFHKAKHYFEKAALEGHTESQYKLGWIYEYGLSDEKNTLKAIEWYEKAVINGHILASLQLAQLYQQSEVLDYRKAFENAKKSAEAGTDIAQFILANLYFFGRGTEADVDMAYRWYEAAYKHGIYQAKFMLDKIDRMF